MRGGAAQLDGKKGKKANPGRCVFCTRAHARGLWSLCTRLRAVARARVCTRGGQGDWLIKSASSHAHGIRAAAGPAGLARRRGRRKVR
jgi:hypothetical protein